jgi:antitoxin component YwqK of YwqJK toxin-antitoxin module
MREGEWLLQYGDHREIGEYAFDLRNGYWKYFDGEDNLIFEGEYIDNNPNGKHYYYWDNGNIKDEIPYSMGLKNGDWKKYDYDGVLLLVISFENGIEKKYDGVKIKPEFTESFDQPYDEYIDE